jgi:hypothetical protein
MMRLYSIAQWGSGWRGLASAASRVLMLVGEHGAGRACRCNAVPQGLQNKESNRGHMCVCVRTHQAAKRRLRP